VQAVLERIRHLLIDRAAMLCNITTDAGNWRAFEPQLRAFLGKLPISGTVSAPWQIDARPGFEGLTVPATVNFVGKGGNIYRLGYQPTGAIWVVMNHLNTTWLWDKLRVEGGAYGVSCHCDTHSGDFAFVSYRDPNLQATLDIFDKSAEFLRAAPVGEAELTRNIIGVIGGMDTYQTPDAKGWTSMANWLIDATDELNQRRREEILSASPARSSASIRSRRMAPEKRRMPSTSTVGTPDTRRFTARCSSDRTSAWPSSDASKQWHKTAAVMEKPILPAGSNKETDNGHSGRVADGVICFLGFA
jgi:Zn-dependent M16 (insulinase) family peptidase